MRTRHVIHFVKGEMKRRFGLTIKKKSWQSLLPLTLTAVVLLVSSGCMVGPNYVRPHAQTAANWIEASDPRIETGPQDYGHWWNAFNDPVLNTLVEMAYRQNLTLRAAGVRVVEAQARRGISIGEIFPQFQELRSSYTQNELSENAANRVFLDRHFNNFQYGFDAAWELDVWGRFRRAIEAADADLLASVANYDDVLVSLVAEVAATYVQIRVLEERLALAWENIRLQQQSLDITTVRFEAGGTTELDVQQATTLLRDTEATIPQLQIELRQAQDSLSVLLGMPPQDLTPILGGSGRIPEPPHTVALDLPIELLRRRPDIRGAEREVAAQSARIGVALTDLLPQFQLVGSIGLNAEEFPQLFAGGAFETIAGPRVRWAILNYGRLINTVRVQDARFQQFVFDYENTVLRAQQEVEDALVVYLRGQEQVRILSESVQAAARAVEIANVQYESGGADYTRVLNSEQAKRRGDDLLITTRGMVAFSIIALYKAFGGGWEISAGKDFVSEETKREMRARVNWGGLLTSEGQASDLTAATDGTEQARGWWRWRWWGPKW
jgi:NodT family efflux transporter outer membrane factor (OMF) lipoprotein